MSIGGGKSGGSQSDPAAGALAGIAQQFAKETTPLRKELIGDFKTILKNPNAAKIPIIGEAVQQSRQASSDALRSTNDDLARSGLSGTPFGQMIRSEQKQSGNIAAANTKTDLWKSIFSMVPNFILGQGQSAMSGLSGAVGGNVSAKGKSMGVGK